jgi:hypothetical protein
MNRTLVVEEGLIADVLAPALSQDRSGTTRWAKLQWFQRRHEARLRGAEKRYRPRLLASQASSWPQSDSFPKLKAGGCPAFRGRCVT